MKREKDFSKWVQYALILSIVLLSALVIYGFVILCKSLISGDGSESITVSADVAAETGSAELFTSDMSELSEDAAAEDAQESASGTSVTETLPEEFLIEDFPIIYQEPELPTGCEITALTMVLNYYGFPADKTVMASVYLPVMDSYLTYYGDDGILYGPDITQYFLGDPFTENGVVCGTQAIVTAANDYLDDQESELAAQDLSGISLDELYLRVSQGQPVVVWTTIGMADRQDISDAWFTENGELVDWSQNDHGNVLIGYSAESVTIADPITGFSEFSREQFESVFASRGNCCVVIG